MKSKLLTLKTCSNRKVTKKNKQVSGRGELPRPWKPPQVDYGTHHSLWRSPRPGHGGVWWWQLPFLLRCFLRHHPHPWYLAQFNPIGNFWPSLPDYLIFKTLKIILLLVHLGLSRTILHTNLKKANTKRSRGNKGINWKIKHIISQKMNPNYWNNPCTHDTSQHGQPMVVSCGARSHFPFVASCGIVLTRGIWHGSTMLGLFGLLCKVLWISRLQKSSSY